MRIEVSIGYKEIDDNGVVTYYGGITDNGECYKDYDAWATNSGVIYVSEGSLCEEEQSTWTREELIDFLYNEVKEYGIGAENDSDFLIWLGEDILSDADWQELSTLFYEYTYYGDWVEDCWDYWNKSHHLTKN